MPSHECCSVLQRACLPRSSAAPFLVNSSFPGLPGACRNKAQGYQGHCSQASCGAAGATAPRTQQLLNAGSFSRTGRMQAEFSLRESILQSHCHQNTHALKSGDRSGNLGAKDGQSDFRGRGIQQRAAVVSALSRIQVKLFWIIATSKEGLACYWDTPQAGSFCFCVFVWGVLRTEPGPWSY